MRIEDFNFHLPAELIAQTAARRGSSRLLVVPKAGGAALHERFQNLSHWLKPGDVLVVNDSRVIPARLWAAKTETQAKIELLLHQEIEPGCWDALARPSRKLKSGTELSIGTYRFRVCQDPQKGQIRLRFASAAQAKKIIARHGVTPLPPYIKRPFRSPGPEERKDRKRYQTIFASQAGSVAAPTAGLHFSQAILKNLEQAGIQILPITLHVGWGTFSPLTQAILETSSLHPEHFNIPDGTADAIRLARHKHRRIIACGTTVARTLEAASDVQGHIRPGAGTTTIFIKPGYHWKQVDGLLTNFHLPCSSLLVLVAAFMGISRLHEVYATAVEERYRFYSYGDAMLCI